MSALAETFRRDGACVVRGLLERGEVERLAAAVDAHMADPSPLAIEGGGDGTSGRFFEDFRNWDRIDGYEEVIRGSRLGEVAADLMGTRTARLHHDHLLVKEPGTTIRTPWHVVHAALVLRRPRARVRRGRLRRGARRAYSVRLIGDDVRLAERPHATSPPFPELDGALVAGDELDHPLFPLLWPRD